MALDYSTLSDEELDAIAKDDYSRLSDATLKALSEDTASSATAQPESSGGLSAADVAGAAGTVAAGAGLLYGASKAAPYVMPALKAAAPVLKKLPGDIGRQYMSRPITGAVADVAALASGLPPPTMTQQTLSAMGQGSKAAAQNVVSTAPGPISPQAMQTPAMQALAQPPKRHNLHHKLAMLETLCKNWPWTNYCLLWAILPARPCQQHKWLQACSTPAQKKLPY